MKPGDLVRVRYCMMPSPRTLESKKWMLKLGVIMEFDSYHPVIKWANGYVNKVHPNLVEIVNESR